jgi:transcriptional regulator with XRE-family HTH domain
MDIGSAIYSLRKKRGFTQSELGLKSGVLQCSISHIEKGIKKPNKATIEKLCNALSIPVEFLNILTIELNGFSESHKEIMKDIQDKIISY